MLVNRAVIEERPLGVQYSLTEYGKALEPTIREMHEWGQTYLTETEDRTKPVI